MPDITIGQPTKEQMETMSLFDAYQFGRYRVIRVPGGWLYERRTRPISRDDWEIVTTFVPFVVDDNL